MMMRRKPRGVRTRSTVLPAPVGGWNAAVPIAEMDKDAAVELVNFFPEERHVRLRNGYTQHATGMGSSDIQTLMAWHGPSSQKMKAAVGTEIYDVTNNGAVGSAEVSSLTNAKWQHCNFTTSGGQFLVCCNGADSVRNYDGSSWTTPSITNVTSSTLVHVTPHKRRLWFVQINTTKAWYLGTEAISGAATAFDFGPLWSRGGYLVAIGSWTLDSGSGPDDFFVAVSSQGQAAVYQGTDPSSATTWALVGVYDIPRPIGRRCIASFGGDLAIITEVGITSMSAMMKTDESAAYGATYSAKIRGAISDAARTYRTVFGWQLIGYPKGRMAILNVPVTGTGQQQYVMNTLTGSWCRFEGMRASCWEEMDGDLYFGAMGIVYKADSGQSDAGAAISWRVFGAPQHFGAPGNLKHFKMVRPIMEVTGEITPRIGINTDYADREPSGVASFVSGSDARWNEVRWNEFKWGGLGRIQARWYSAGGYGTVGAVRMQGQALNNNIKIMQFDVLYEPGHYV